MKVKVFQSLWNCTYGKNCSDAMDSRWGFEVECQLLWAPRIYGEKEKKPATLSNILVEEINVLANYLKMRNQKKKKNITVTLALTQAVSLTQKVWPPVCPVLTIPYCFTLYLLHSIWYLPEPHRLFNLWLLVSNVTELLVTLASLKATKWPNMKDTILGLIWSILGQLPIDLLRSQYPHP